MKSKKALPIVYKDTKLECGYRIDLVLVVEDSIVLEIKSVEQLNFPCGVLKNGIKTMVNEFAHSAFSAISAVNKN